MDLKIGRYFCDNLTSKDWILDNGACYQIMTRRRKDYTRAIPAYIPIIISKKQFAQLKKEGIIVPAPDVDLSNYFSDCKAYRFNDTDTEEENGKK